MTHKKYAELELFRFVLSVAMVCYHLLIKLSDYFPDETVYSTLSGYNHMGRSGVLIFFIFSGFFLYRSLNSSVTVESFVKKRFIRLWPVMAFTLLINFNGKGDFYNFFFLSPGMGVVKAVSSNPAMWYVCCLFWVSIIYFLLFSGCSEKQWRRINAILFIVVFIALGLISHRTNSLKYDALVSEHIPFLTNGFTYGIVGLSIGILFAQLKPNRQIKSKSLVSIFQFTSMGYFIWLNLMCSKAHEMIYYIVWALIIMYFLIYQQGLPPSLS